MARRIVLAVMGILCLTMGIAQGGPYKKEHYREQRIDKLDFRTVGANSSYQFEEFFYDNQRACVIVEGNHKESGVNLTLTVWDAAGKVVAEDKAGGDCVAAIWYPRKVQLYRIVITNSGSASNELDIVVK